MDTCCMNAHDDERSVFVEVRYVLMIAYLHGDDALT